MMTHLEIRKAFLDYFQSKGHTIVPSSPLVPIDDPSMLFTTAGMVQFKPLFAGIVELPYTRATSIQKCFRLSDLENIGRTARHHTFFEMFGNFSFGDYFKKGAIEFAWEFSTEVLNLSKERLYVSIFENDDDAFDIWNKHIGIPKEKIVRLGKKDNFWGPAGDSGACGPCSELYIDMGEERSCGKPDCGVGCDCERYLEYWNLVFNEFFQNTEGVQTPLPQTGIDTGMGLERLAYILQGVESNYQTDLMKWTIDGIIHLCDRPYEGENVYAMNVIADHMRALVFTLAEGVMPGNEGRGYVLRRVLRRALKTAGLLGIEEPLLHTLVGEVVQTYKDVYPELAKEQEKFIDVVKKEEQRFFATVSHGLVKLDEMLTEQKEQGTNTLSGKNAFLLFDTYGLPLDITLEEAKEKGFSVDTDAFKELMEAQRKRSRGADVKGGDTYAFVEETNETVYKGDDETLLAQGLATKVVGLYVAGARATSAGEGENVVFVTEESVCYAEKGGQVGDKGRAVAGDTTVTIEDTQQKDGVTLHVGRVEKGVLETGMPLTLTIDGERRRAIRRNHTTTHILQKVLQKTIGDHVKQAGSYVSDTRLRFDFSHYTALSEEELLIIEREVNKVIAQALPVDAREMPKEDAMKEGAVALFGEKYGDVVRLVSIDDFSKELCGGSHLANTADAGFFHILQESSIASGVRRIEAVTGEESARIATETLHKAKNLLRTLNAGTLDEVKTKFEKAYEENKNLQKEVETLKTKGLTGGNTLDAFEEVNGTRVYTHILEGEDVKTLRAFADALKEREQDHVLVLVASGEKSNSVIVQVAKATTKKGLTAKEVLATLHAETGGKGGGKDTFAQGGIDAFDKVEDAFTKVKAYITEHLG